MAVDQHRDLYSPCCFNKHPRWSGYQTIEQYWHSEDLARLRRDLGQGVRDPGCQDCWTAEDHGQMSLRQTVLQDTDRWAGCLEQPRVTQVKLLTGNTCNLACMMCFGTVSSSYHDLWRGDATWIMPEAKSRTSEYDWNMDRYIREHVDDLRFIEVLGGEPLFNKDFLDLVSHLVDTGASDHFTLFVITNGTLFVPRFQDLFSRFKKTVFTISVDGLGVVNDYQRWPSDWSVIERNIKTIDQWFDVSILPTVTAINIIGLPKLIDWCQSQGYVINNIGLVDHWPQLLPVNLPDQLKPLVSQQFRSMTQGPGRPDQLIDFIRRWDQRRGINIKDYMPEWTGLV